MEIDLKSHIVYDFLKSKLDLEDYKLPKAIRQGRGEPCNWNGLELWPTPNYCHVANRESINALGLKGLRIKITWGLTAHIHIENSPHKVMNGGHNHNDFTYSQMVDYITLVSDSLGIPYWEAKPWGKIELAVNLKDSDPSQFITELHSHKSKPFELMKDNNKIYGKRSNIMAFRPKIYNPWYKYKYSKGMKPQFNNTVLRCEAVTKISYLNKRKGISIRSIKDLTSKPLIQKLGRLLSNRMRPITFYGRKNGVTGFDLAVYYFLQYGTRQEFSRINRTTLKRYGERHRKVLKLMSHRVNDLPERILSKWTELARS